jgi:hypothetical protein
MSDEQTYEITRFYAPHRTEANKTIKSGLTLAEAQEHCEQDDTKEEGEWFEGYQKE